MNDIYTKSKGGFIKEDINYESKKEMDQNYL